MAPSLFIPFIIAEIIDNSAEDKESTNTYCEQANSYRLYLVVGLLFKKKHFKFVHLSAFFWAGSLTRKIITGIKQALSTQCEKESVMRFRLNLERDIRVNAQNIFHGPSWHARGHAINGTATF